MHFMHKPLILTLAGFLMFVIFSPHTVFGEDMTQLYTFNFTTQTDKADLYVPIIAGRDGIGTKSRFRLPYSMEEDGTETQSGLAYGLVLSDAEIVDGMYKIPAGTTGTFKLLVLYSLTDRPLDSEYELSLDRLHFFLKRDDRFSLYRHKIDKDVPALLEAHIR